MNDLKYNIYWHFKNKRNNKRALKALKIIEGYKGKTDPKLIQQSNAYAKTVLGSKVYAPWLYVYSALQNSFKEGWIPDNYYKKEVVPRLKGDYGNVANRNFITPLLFRNLKTLDIAYFLNARFVTTNNEVLNTDTVKDYIFKDDDKLVYKLENSQSGKGVSIFYKNNFDVNKFISTSNSNGVFQKFIQQHQFFSEFTKNSVATIRITTISDNKGNISARAAFLKMARSHETHVAGSSAVYISIDLSNGELQPVGHEGWIETSMHQDSKVKFSGKKIPNFDKCKLKALQMHSKIPFMGCIGWDMAIDKYDNIQLIEWNGKNNGISYSEGTVGPCFTGLGWEDLWREKQLQSK